MEKKKLIAVTAFLLVVFFWILIVGQINGISGIRGDINLIDEGQFGAWINHMLHGKIMYKDFFPPYGPLQVYPLYFLVKIFGPSFFVVRFYLSVLGVFLGICAAFTVLRFLNVNRTVGSIAMGFFILYPSVHIRSWIGVLCLALLVRSYSSRSFRTLFLIGMLVAFAVLQSVEAGVFTLIIIAGYVATRFIKKTDFRNDKISLLVLSGGFTMSLVIFSVFAAREGWLFYYLKSTVDFLTSVTGVNLPNGQGLPNFLSDIPFESSPIFPMKIIFSKPALFYWNIILLLLFQTIIVIRFMLKKITNGDITIFLISCYAFLSYISIIGRSGHAFLFAPFIVLFSGYYLSFVFPPKSTLRKDYKFAGILFFVLFICFIVRYLIIYRYSPFLDFKSKSNNSVERVAPLVISPGQAADIQILQDFINRTTTKKDTIFILNNLPGFYFLLDRENATKFDFPLLAILKKDREELVSALEKNKPIYIIEDNSAWAVDEVSDRRRLPEVVYYMRKNYIPYKTLGHYTIFKKR